MNYYTSWGHYYDKSETPPCVEVTEDSLFLDRKVIEK